MIRVFKDFDAPPTGLTSVSCQAKQQDALAEKTTHVFSSYYYRDSAIAALRTIYGNKCGYCETHESGGAALRVDHYRPKNKITGVANHEGYYWLAYEWSNLILSCEKCNRRKSNSFPIQDETYRISQPVLGLDGLPTIECCRVNQNILLHENPLLLNPELDNPDNHLLFQPNGTITAQTLRGSKSIELYFLLRDELITNRKKMTDDVVEKLKKHLLKFLKREIDEQTYRYAMQDVYEEADISKQADKSYSRVALTLFSNFETFVVAQFPTNQQAYIRQSFDLYKQGRLWPLPK